MNQESTIITRSFQPWKIWLAILIGLLAAGIMLFFALSKTQFVRVSAGTGTHSWTDTNGNGQVDAQDSLEFVPSASGNYKKMGVTDALSSVHWTSVSFLYLLLAMVLMVGRDFFYIVRIRLLTHNHLSWKSGFNVILLWEFASALSPGVVGGAAVAMFILNREKIPLGKSTAIVFITALMDNLFYVVMIPLVFLVISSQDLFPATLSFSNGVEFAFWLGFLLIVAITLFLFLAIFIFPKLAGSFLGLLFRLPILRRWREKALETGKEIEVTSAEMRVEPFSHWVRVFAATCGSWICRYLVINLVLQAFIGFGWIEHIAILGKQLVLWLFMLVSPTPGGSGVAEFAFSELLEPFAQSSILLIALAVIWRLISYFPYLFIGAFLLPRWLQKSRNR